MTKHPFFRAGLGACLALALVSCGGGGSALPPKTRTGQVYVMGDSLADVGTFGFKFTVQDAGNAKGFPVWPQLVANVMGVDGSAQCNVYVSTFNPVDYTDVYTDNPTAGCTNYAIGGSRIIVPGKPDTPRNVFRQLQRRAGMGDYAATDLTLISVGGNDAADLVGAYLGVNSDGGLAKFQAFLGQQLDTGTRDALLSQPNGGALAAGAYLQTLADTFAAQIKSQVLDKGAKRVAVLNIPDITLTPRFQMVLQGVALSTNPATAQAIQAAIRQWIGAFNARLAATFASDARVVVVDFYADFTEEVSSPASFQLSDVRSPVCPITGVDAQGLPNYLFTSCTSTVLDGSPPAGQGTGWWKSHAFSDGFHPTPYGHQLLTASVSRALARAGWL